MQNGNIAQDVRNGRKYCRVMDQLIRFGCERNAECSEHSCSSMYYVVTQICAVGMTSMDVDSSCPLRGWTGDK